MLADLWQGVPDPLRDPVALAAPLVVVFIALEALAAALLEADDPRRYDRALAPAEA